MAQSHEMGGRMKMVRNWFIPDAETFFENHALIVRNFNGRAFMSDPYGVSSIPSALEHCRSFRTAIDGGAHIGTWSTELAGTFTKILSFEPSPDSYECLVANARRFSNIVPINAALGEAGGFISMRDDPHPRRKGNTGAREVVLGGGDIPILTIDSLNIEDLDFMKLDVETSELSVLRGARMTIEKCSPTIMIEVKQKRAEHDPLQAVAFLEWLGYHKVDEFLRDWVFCK
jgi:FkbM family methyltransferase